MVHSRELRFLELQTKEELACFLNIPVKELTFFAYSGKCFYKDWYIPKQNGCGRRCISSPVPKLKTIQRKIAFALSEIYEAPNDVHGFVENRSTASNAIQHVGKKAIIKIDLEDFFQTITEVRVQGLFRSGPFCFPTEVATALAKLVCHEGCLPQGAPTSPVLSNMICFRMDKALRQYAEKRRLRYTRYADDIVFSSTRVRSLRVLAPEENETESVVLDEAIERIIAKNGFSINREKTGYFSNGTRQVVTGIVVNAKCNFRRSSYRYLRSMFHDWKSSGAEHAARRYVEDAAHGKYKERFFTEEDEFIEGAFVSHVHGLLSYYQMIQNVNRHPSDPLMKLWTNLHDVSGIKVPDMIPERSVFQTDTMLAYRNRGEASFSREYGEYGSAFIARGVGMLGAKHSFVPKEYPTIDVDQRESVIDLRGHEMQIDLDYESMRFDYADDWASFDKPAPLDALPGLKIASEFMLQRGERITAYGYADGNSQLRRIEACVCEILGNEVVVDRAFVKGMSGGPVLNARGEVVGLITWGSGDREYDRDGRFLLLNSISPVTSCLKLRDCK